MGSIKVDSIIRNYLAASRIKQAAPQARVNLYKILKQIKPLLVETTTDYYTITISAGCVIVAIGDETFKV